MSCEGRSPAVLLVDDEEFFRMTVRETLAARVPHLELFEASDGVEAVEILDKHAVDVVVTDLAMPRMDGTELLREMLRRRSKVPVVVVSAYAHDSPALEGAPRCVAKPVDLGQLCGHVETLLREPATRSSSHVTPAGLIQILSWERRTCLLEVSADHAGERRRGFLQMSQGKLCSARIITPASTIVQSGSDDALEMLAWDEADVDIVTVRPPSATALANVDVALHHLFARARTRRQARSMSVRMSTAP